MKLDILVFQELLPFRSHRTFILTPLSSVALWSVGIKMCIICGCTVNVDRPWAMLKKRKRVSEWVSEWVSDCFLTPTQQLFSYIMARQVNLNEMMMMSALYSPRVDMSPHSDTLSWFRAKQSLHFVLAVDRGFDSRSGQTKDYKIQWYLLLLH